MKASQFSALAHSACRQDVLSVASLGGIADGPEALADALLGRDHTCYEFSVRYYCPLAAGYVTLTLLYGVTHDGVTHPDTLRECVFEDEGRGLTELPDPHNVWADTRSCPDNTVAIDVLYLRQYSEYVADLLAKDAAALETQARNNGYASRAALEQSVAGWIESELDNSQQGG